MRPAAVCQSQEDLAYSQRTRVQPSICLTDDCSPSALWFLVASCAQVALLRNKSKLAAGGWQAIRAGNVISSPCHGGATHHM